MSNFVFTNRSCILATTAPRQTIGAMNARKPLSSWNAIAAASGASGNGGNVDGASTSAANTVVTRMAAATIVTGIVTARETTIEAVHSFIRENGNGAPQLSRGAPFSFCNREENQREFTSSSSEKTASNRRVSS